MLQLWSSALCWACWPQSTSPWLWELSTGTSTAGHLLNPTGATPPSLRSSPMGSLMRRLTGTPCTAWTAHWDCGGGAYWCPASHTGSKSRVRTYYISTALLTPLIFKVIHIFNPTLFARPFRMCMQWFIWNHSLNLNISQAQICAVAWLIDFIVIKKTRIIFHLIVCRSWNTSSSRNTALF